MRARIAASIAPNQRHELGRSLRLETEGRIPGGVLKGVEREQEGEGPHVS